MSRQQQQHTVENQYGPKWRRVLLTVVLSLTCSLLTGCQTVKPANSTLKDLQEWATPEPLDRLSPRREQVRTKAAMVRWTEQYLKDEYRVIDQRFVFTAPGFTEPASLGSKANQYVTQTLDGVLHTDGWLDDNNYALFLWKLGDDDSPRYIAFVIMTNNFLPGTRERRLVGFLELTRKDQLERVIVAFKLCKTDFGTPRYPIFFHPARVTKAFSNLMIDRSLKALA